MFSKHSGNMHIYALRLFIFFDPVILLQGIYPKEIIFDTEKALCIKLFIKTLCIVVQNWEQPKYSRNKVWKCNLMEYYGVKDNIKVYNNKENSL